MSTKRSVTSLLAIIGSLASWPATGLAAQQMLPRDIEMELAESTLPPHLRAGATLYVFNIERGFQVVREGTNGFHAFVSRLEPAAFRGSWSYDEHPDDVLLPIAFDATGAETTMRLFFDAHELLAQGTPAPELKGIMRERLLTGEYKSPQRPGVAYMLAPLLRAYRDPYNSPTRNMANIPHRMFYAPNIDNDDIGGDFGTIGPFVIQSGPFGFMIVRSSEEEKAAINEEYSGMLRRLCEFREIYCLSAGG